ncbi:MAG: hypothetical protein CSA50_01030 [Gammaproteobacteria bacterium]|nr:MAG: hypothetical protein CSA50_01030 [Gammaproteobacteria bacterium]
MLYWLGFAGLTAVFVASVCLSTIAYKKQQRIRYTNNQIRQIRRKIDELSEIKSTLLKTDDEYDILLFLQQKILAYLSRIHALKPNATEINEEINKEAYHLDNYKNGIRKNEIQKAVENDSEIKSTNIRLSALIRLLLATEKMGSISKGKCADLIYHTQKLKLDIEVESHLKQSESYLANDDRVTAQTHLKQAKKALRSSPVEYPEKTQQIKEISARIKAITSQILVNANVNSMPVSGPGIGQSD